MEVPGREQIVSTGGISGPGRFLHGVLVHIVVADAGVCVKALDAARIEVQARLPGGLEPFLGGEGVIFIHRHSEHLHLGPAARFRRILGIADENQLVGGIVPGNHRVPIEQNPVPAFEFLVILGNHRHTAGNLGIAEPAFLVFILQHNVHHFLLVVFRADSGESRIVLGLVDYLDLVDNLRRKVLDRHRRVLDEEGLAADGDLVDGLSIDLDRPSGFHLHAGHFLQQVDQHRIVDHVIGRRIVFDGVFLDNHRIADSRYLGRFQEFAVFLQLDDTEVPFVFETADLQVILFDKRLVSDQFRVQFVLFLDNAVDDRDTFFVRHGKVGDDRIALGNQVHGRIGDRQVRRCVPQLHACIQCSHPLQLFEVLRPEKKRKERK